VIALGEVTPAVPEELIREVVVADDQLRFVSSVEGRSPAADAPEANPWTALCTTQANRSGW
jgi:hypothetical protein